jgi:hypothetical protein
MRSSVLILRRSYNFQRTLLVILYTIICKMTFLVFSVWPLKMPWRISYSIKYTTLSLHIYDWHGSLMLIWYLFRMLALHISQVYCWQLGDPCCLYLHRHDHPITLPVLITHVCQWEQIHLIHQVTNRDKNGSLGTAPFDSSSDRKYSVKEKYGHLSSSKGHLDTQYSSAP